MLTPTARCSARAALVARPRRGFTLVEMLVAIVVACLLLGMAIANSRNTTRRALVAQVHADASTAATVLEADWPRVGGFPAVATFTPASPQAPRVQLSRGSEFTVDAVCGDASCATVTVRLAADPTLWCRVGVGASARTIPLTCSE